MKRVTESVKTWERRAVLGIMEGASDERDPLPSIKPSCETPAKEDEKMSEQPRTNNITCRTGLRRLEKCHHLDISSYLIQFFNDTWGSRKNGYFMARLTVREGKM